MGHVIHMLEVDDFLYRDDHRAGQRVCLNQQEKSTEKTAPESVEHWLLGDVGFSAKCSKVKDSTLAVFSWHYLYEGA
ncbi:hypothetical protein HPP92_011641 [Vanilla planifolia]|uniref:Uncharacterized protein n=1 Tax=Vanilla planifolia TaxID=51239 RepID=A0A835RBY7_VANPL|nr:hypothetical protein HPP92_011641 [Vanilla planifolia]